MISRWFFWIGVIHDTNQVHLICNEANIIHADHEDCSINVYWSAPWHVYYAIMGDWMRVLCGYVPISYSITVAIRTVQHVQSWKQLYDTTHLVVYISWKELVTCIFLVYIIYMKISRFCISSSKIILTSIRQ